MWNTPRLIASSLCERAGECPQSHSQAARFLCESSDRAFWYRTLPKVFPSVRTPSELYGLASQRMSLQFLRQLPTITSYLCVGTHAADTKKQAMGEKAENHKAAD